MVKSHSIVVIAWLLTVGAQKLSLPPPSSVSLGYELRLSGPGLPLLGEDGSFNAQGQSKQSLEEISLAFGLLWSPPFVDG